MTKAILTVTKVLVSGRRKQTHHQILSLPDDAQLIRNLWAKWPMPIRWLEEGLEYQLTLKTTKAEIARNTAQLDLFHSRGNPETVNGISIE